jgi:23S rRNA pseudouridine2605 synthase
MGEERLQKILAAAGFGSRRACETLVLEGRVSVDGAVVTQLGVRADPARQTIVCDGRPVRSERPVYWLLNKPRGYVCTNHDPEGRPRAVDLLPRGLGRLYTIGRLDTYSEGLVLLTNDGAFAHRVMHPRFEVSKTYHAQVEGWPEARALMRLTREGVALDGYPARADAARVLGRAPGGAWVEVVLHEGRNREVRRLLEAVGHPVRRLLRVRIGPVEDPRLPAGRARPLTPAECAALTAGAASPGAPRDRPPGA